MRVFRNSISDMIHDVVNEFLRQEEKPVKGRKAIEQYKLWSKKAWALIEECADRKTLSEEAGRAFWEAVANCTVTRKGIADRLNELRLIENKKEINANNVRDLLSDARRQVKECVESKLGVKIWTK